MSRDFGCGREGERMKNKLTYNWHLKLLSILLAFILWLVVVNMNDPDITKKFYNIPIEILNEDKITGQGQGQVYKVDYPTNKTAVATFKGARSIIDGLKTGDIKATVDFSDVSSVGAVKINFTTPDGVTLVDAGTENMRISIEALELKTFPIQFQAVGTPADSFVLGEVGVSPNVVKIKAPKSIMETIKKVIVETDVDGLSTNLTNVSARIKILDGNGAVIEYGENTDVTVSVENVLVSAAMLKTREVPISMKVTGNPVENYRYIGMNYTPNKVKIKGTKEAVEEVNSIVVPAEADLLSLEGLTANKEVTVDISEYLPEGISLADENERYITVNLYIEPLYTKTIEIPTSSLTVENRSENILISYGTTQNLSVDIHGLKEDLEQVSLESLQPSIDLRGLGVGVHSCPVNVKLSGDVKALNKLTITVIITEKQPETTSSEETETQTSSESIGATETGSDIGTETSSPNSAVLQPTSSNSVPVDVKPTDEQQTNQTQQNTTPESTELETES